MGMWFAPTWAPPRPLLHKTTLTTGNSGLSTHQIDIGIVWIRFVVQTTQIIGNMICLKLHRGQASTRCNQSTYNDQQSVHRTVSFVNRENTNQCSIIHSDFSFYLQGCRIKPSCGDSYVIHFEFKRRNWLTNPCAVKICFLNLCFVYPQLWIVIQKSLFYIGAQFTLCILLQFEKEKKTVQ